MLGGVDVDKGFSKGWRWTERLVMVGGVKVDREVSNGGRCGQRG